MYYVNCIFGAIGVFVLVVSLFMIFTDSQLDRTIMGLVHWAILLGILYACSWACVGTLTTIFSGL